MTGRYEILVRLLTHAATLSGRILLRVHADRGLRTLPDLSFPNAPKADVLVVPGGPGVQNLMEDQEVLDFLRTQRRRRGTLFPFAPVPCGELQLAFSTAIAQPPTGFRYLCRNA